MSRFVGFGLLTALAAVGCLPAGEPPQGQHLVTGRDSLGVQFQDMGPDAPRRLLTYAPTHDENAGVYGVYGLDLFDIPAPDPATGRAQANLLLGRTDYTQSCDSCGYPVDARGRLVLAQEAGQNSEGFLDINLFLVDPDTSARVDLGRIDSAALSHDRQLLLLQTGTSWRVRDLDGHETDLPDVESAMLVGNDVYFVTADHELFRLRETALAAPPEHAASDVGTFQPFPTARGPLIVLARPTEMPYTPTTHALFDPATFTEAPLPGETGLSQTVALSASSTGRTVLFNSYEYAEAMDRMAGRLRLTLLDRDSGASQTEMLDDALYGSYWRPGHEEIWIQANGGLLRWRAGEPLEHFPGRLFTAPSVRPGQSIFTADGRLFLSYGPPAALVSADDPTADPLPLHMSGEILSAYWSLPDGRGIVESFATFQFHNDMTLVDPVARTTKPLATGGYVVAAGAHRALVFVDWVKSTSSGTLTLVDLETGARTTLGENVYFVAVDAAPLAEERLPAGVRVAFLVRNRIASPYDGLWLTTLP